MLATVLCCWLWAHWVYGLFPGTVPDEGDYRHLYPVLSLNVYLEDHAHALPYLFGLIENLDYPKDRISLNVLVGTHFDATLEKAKWWLKGVGALYRSTYLVEDAENWREEALVRSRLSNAKYAFLMRGDHFLWDSRVLQHLIAKKRVVVSPLLHGPFGDNSSFFVSEKFDSREEIATHQVARAVEPLLIDTSHTDATYLTFSRDNIAHSEYLPVDPLSVFTVSADRMDIPLFVDNEFFYGYFFDSSLYSLSFRRQLIRYFVANLVSDYGLMPLIYSAYVAPSYPKPSLFSVDRIYVINLLRRAERRQKMSEVLKLIGVDYELWRATDGKLLQNEEFAADVVPLPGYEDPYHKRPMKAGEIGCFLSHYRIWRDVVEKSFSRVIVFEDDLRFVLNSTSMLVELIDDLDRTALQWDLVYLGRKRLENVQENWVAGHRHLSTVGYSYWTLGYLLSRSGAEKLLRAEPLKKMVPVDEYIPIMFNQHPNTTWKEAFPRRDLIAYTIYPTIVVPERYTNEQGYYHRMGCVWGKADVEVGDRQFNINKLLAKGGFSEVFMVSEVGTSQRWALKQVECHSSHDVERVRREIDVHERFGSHPNILALECLSDELINGVRRFSLIFIFFKKGSLQDELTSRRTHNDYMEEDRVIRLFTQISSAVSFLHSSAPSIAHRDLKPGNILLSEDDRPVLMDFGSCCECPLFIETSKQSKFQLINEAAELCSMPYRAPELFVCAIGSVIDQSIDIWSLGCLLYAICFFRSPFDDIYERGDSIALAVQSGKITFEEQHPFSSKIVELIRTMLKVEPKERPTIQTVCELIRKET
ncbi:Glycosyltransferase 25 family member [Toxocara canis]|uniref:non-specific serine/threonine protein kinase n=2 Tax=Toxocara canis TaxID=6265 RepID=A0A0B2V5Z8_TOXCA|nr:Glycosyltransferase 25 family member [Toxocara canis]